MKKELTPTAYQQLHRFAELTNRLILQGNIARAQRCLNTAEQLFLSGNKLLQDNISTIYVFSVSTFMELHQLNVKSFFPPKLKQAYQQQTHASSL